LPVLQSSQAAVTVGTPLLDIGETHRLEIVVEPRTTPGRQAIAYPPATGRYDVRVAARRVGARRSVGAGRPSRTIGLQMGIAKCKQT